MEKSCRCLAKDASAWLGMTAKIDFQNSFLERPTAAEQVLHPTAYSLRFASFLGFRSAFLPNLAAQAFMDFKPGAVTAPLTAPLVEVVEDILPRRILFILFGQIAPLTAGDCPAGDRQIQRSVDDAAQIHCARAATPSLHRKQIFDMFPLALKSGRWGKFELSQPKSTTQTPAQSQSNRLFNRPGSREFVRPAAFPARVVGAGHRVCVDDCHQPELGPHGFRLSRCAQTKSTPDFGRSFCFLGTIIVTIYFSLPI